MADKRKVPNIDERIAYLGDPVDLVRKDNEQRRRFNAMRGKKFTIVWKSDWIVNPFD